MIILTQRHNLLRYYAENNKSSEITPDFGGSPYIDFHNSDCYGARLWNQEM